jgi:hypothetical protein
MGRVPFYSLSFQGVTIDESDYTFFNSRISLITEEENLKIYEKINNLDDKMRSKIYPFSFLWNDFFSMYDSNISKGYLYSSFYLALHNDPILFVADNMNQIIKYDEEFKTYFETKLLEFYAFIVQYNKIQSDIKQDEDEKLMERTKEYEDMNNLIMENAIDNFNQIFISNSNFKKSSLKPFNKEEILMQTTCETDYGNKKITKKDLKNREEYIKKMISTANKELYEEIEGQIIKSDFIEKSKKVVFCIPNDRSSILNKLNQ